MGQNQDTNMQKPDRLKFKSRLNVFSTSFHFCVYCILCERLNERMEKLGELRDVSIWMYVCVCVCVRFFL